MFRQTAAMALMALLAIFVASCAAGSGLKPLPPAPSSEYKLDSGDKLTVNVYGDPRLTGSYLIADSGDISMPLIGAIQARGLTVAELRDAIGNRLRDQGIILYPSVSAQVEQFRPFFILGEITRPGQYPYVEGMTVLTAVAIGGGFTFRAEKEQVTVTRRVNGKALEYKAERDSQILPGDVIYVFERYI